ncbi:hypothetical protein PVK06_044377 [Gossypium arboreum]|uniref:Uncharacterized protein n=1 Tax=Gossypium arboreum TaxID=29729 RepID=A0ABR0MRK1_GOSAR|nr:hypothetical protein PVK06_044377 [Gossypium arboreum]
MDIIYATRVFIFQLIGGILLPDINQNKVSIIWPTVPGIGQSFTVPIYHMMIETHSGDAVTYDS